MRTFYQKSHHPSNIWRNNQPQYKLIGLRIIYLTSSFPSLWYRYSSTRRASMPRKTVLSWTTIWHVRITCYLALSLHEELDIDQELYCPDWGGWFSWRVRKLRHCPRQNVQRERLEPPGRRFPKGISALLHECRSSSLNYSLTLGDRP